MLLKNLDVKQIIRMAIFLLLTLGLLVTTHPNVMAASEEEQMIENAKREGRVVWYSGSDIIIVNALRAKFEEKYPFIKAEAIRLGSAQLTARILTEARARVFHPDVIQVQIFDMVVLGKEGLVAKYISQENKYYPESLKDPEGYWTSNHINAKGIVYNTNLVSSKDAPKSWEDILDPRWKGKIMMDPTEVEWYSTMLKAWGREKGLEFMKKLSEQKVIFREGQDPITLLMAAGEYPIGIALNIDRVEYLRLNGAPLKWTGGDPAIVRLRPLAMTKNSSHPNAAKLFINFLLSVEGQKVLADIGGIPARLGFESPALKGAKTCVTDISLASQYKENMKEFRQIFFRK